MSIYGSLPAPSDAEHILPGCAMYVEDEPGCFEFSGKECDCGQPEAPLAYRGSHVLPSDDDPRGGCVDIASIPSHITRDGRDGQPEDGTPWPYLRFGVNEATVVLLPAHVKEIVETLTGWLSEVERV